MEKTVLLDGKELSYTLERKKVKNIILKISPEGTVSVSAPFRVPVKTIEEFLQAKRKWIWKKILLSEQRLEEKHQRDICILGKNYWLKMLSSSNYGVDIQENFIIIRIKNSNDMKEAKKTFLDWYKNYSRQVLEARHQVVYDKIAYLGFPKAELKFRMMKARWGSCYYNKRMITINSHLVQLPIELIDHVLLHEYAHLIYHDHGAEFKKFLCFVESNGLELEKTIRHTTHDVIELLFQGEDDES